MNGEDVDDIALNLLLDGIFARYGYDFRNYARASLKRRILIYLQEQELSCISELIPRVLHTRKYFGDLLSEVFVSVTEMFRDPPFFLDLRQRVIPLLRTYPFIKIWHAGCATGQEVYSMAILLHEAELLERTTLYCTDLNDRALSKAKSGIYRIDDLERYESNYRQAGGLASLADYYHSKYEFGKIHDHLRKNIVFSMHNLACDGVFNEMHVILCRNVFIYFDKHLQDQVTALFADSLINGGFLCMGDVETIEHLNSFNAFSVFSKKNRIFRKTTL